jgi:hypothetical protein
MTGTTAEIALCPKTDFRSKLLKVSGRYTVISGNSAALSSTTPLMYPVYPAWNSTDASNGTMNGLTISLANLTNIF